VAAFDEDLKELCNGKKMPVEGDIRWDVDTARGYVWFEGEWREVVTKNV
jgi:hypothetical protein